MKWELVDHAFWTSLVAFAAFVGAVVAAYFQYKINKLIHHVQDSVELYSYHSNLTIRDGEKEVNIPQIFIKNVGTRIIYLDRYVFNGRVYLCKGQVLPPSYAYSDAFYRIDLPMNGEKYVSLVKF